MALENFVKNIILNIVKEEKYINSFYESNFSNFLNPFVILNMDKSVEIIKEAVKNKNSGIIINFDNNLGAAAAGYLLTKYFKWQNRNVFLEGTNGIIKTDKNLSIIVGNVSCKNYSDVKIRISENDIESSELCISNKFNDEKYGDFKMSVEILTLKLIQALFLSDDEVFTKTYVSLDIETTGAKPTDEITEIGAVKYRRGIKIDKFQTLVNPKKNIPTYITQLTGISDEMVKSAPFIDTAVKNFDIFLNDVQFIVVHNGGFDISFLSQRFKKFLNKRFNFKSYDTRMIAQSTRPLSGLSLQDISNDMGVELLNAHRALADAEATGDSFIKLMILNNIRLKVFTYRYIGIVILSLLDTAQEFTGENRLFLITALKNLNKCKIYSINSNYKKNKNSDSFNLLKSFYKYMNGFKNFNKYDKLKYFEKTVDEIPIDFSKSKEYELDTKNYINLELNKINLKFATELENLVPLSKNNYKPVFAAENVIIKNCRVEKNKISGVISKDKCDFKIYLKKNKEGLLNKIYFIIEFEKFLFFFKKIVLREV